MEIKEKLKDLSDEDIVTMEVAKHIKSLGFDKPTYHYYIGVDIFHTKKGLRRVKLGARRMNHNKYDEFVYSAPTKKDCLKWMKKRLNN